MGLELGSLKLKLCPAAVYLTQISFISDREEDYAIGLSVSVCL